MNADAPELQTFACAFDARPTPQLKRPICARGLN